MGNWCFIKDMYFSSSELSLLLGCAPGGWICVGTVVADIHTYLARSRTQRVRGKLEGERLVVLKSSL